MGVKEPSPHLHFYVDPVEEIVQRAIIDDHRGLARRSFGEPEDSGVEAFIIDAHSPTRRRRTP
jgi:hypothetical protein